jgi:hypothetical protein
VLAGDGHTAAGCERWLACCVGGHWGSAETAVIYLPNS